MGKSNNSGITRDKGFTTRESLGLRIGLGDSRQNIRRYVMLRNVLGSNVELKSAELFTPI